MPAQKKSSDKAERHFTVLRSSFDANQRNVDSSYKGDFTAAAKKAGKVLFTRFPEKKNETLYVEIRETTKSKPKSKKDKNVKTFKVICEKLKKPITIKRGDVEITVNKHYDAAEVDEADAEKHLKGKKTSGGGGDSGSGAVSMSGSKSPSGSGSGSPSGSGSKSPSKTGGGSSGSPGKSGSGSPSKSGSGSPSKSGSKSPSKSGTKGGFFDFNM